MGSPRIARVLVRQNYNSTTFRPIGLLQVSIYGVCEKRQLCMSMSDMMYEGFGTFCDYIASYPAFLSQDFCHLQYDN